MGWDSIGTTRERGGPPGPYLSLCLIGLLLGAVQQVQAEKDVQNYEFSISDLCEASFMKHHNRKIQGAVIRSQGERNINCVLTFQTDSVLQRFMVRFERLTLDCNDHLYIYDGAYAMGTYKADLSCRNTLSNVGTIYTQTNHVTLKYVTDAWGPVTNGFKLLITAFKDKKQPCYHFHCETTNFCVDTGLTCDGVNHCGDGSDESTSLAHCPSQPIHDLLGVSSTMLAAMMASGVLLCCACGIIVTVCVYRRNRPPPLQPQQQQLANTPQYPNMELGGTYGSNGTFGTLLGPMEKPPPYPGAPQHKPVMQDGRNGSLGRWQRLESGKPGSPCVRGGVQYAQAPNRSLLPIAVRASGSESDVSSTQKEEWFV